MFLAQRFLMEELRSSEDGVPSSQILVILMMEALSSSETSVLPTATRRNFPEDYIIQVIILMHTYCLPLYALLVRLKPHNICMLL
jgi:hypothetical protein